MAKLTVNIGQSANDRQGDNLRTAFSKINGNFDEIYLSVDTLTSQVAAIQSGGTSNSASGNTIVGDIQGSVIAEDSTVLVDGVGGAIDAGNLTGALPAIDGSALTGVTVSSIAFSNVTGTPTTLAGYGIADAYTKAEVDSAITSSVLPSGSTQSIDIVAADSTLLVDSVNGIIPGSVIDGQISVPSISGVGGGSTNTLDLYADLVGQVSKDGQKRIFATDTINDVFEIGTTAPYSEYQPTLKVYGNAQFGSITLTGGSALTGDVTGSVFADDSTLLVDGVNGTLNSSALTKPIALADNEKITFGDDDDLEIFHNSSNGNTIIENTGNLVIKGSNLFLQSASSEYFFRGAANGAVTLYYDNVAKFETTADGVSVTGKITGLTDPTAAQDAATKAYVDASVFDGAFGSLSGTPTTLAGYGITDAANTGSATTFTANVLFDTGVQEKFATLTGSTGVTAMDCDNGQVFYLTGAAGDITANFTNLGLTAEYGTNVTVIINQGATPYEVTAVQIGGAAQTINWQGGTPPTGNTNGIDSFSFTILNDGGTYVVLGQMVDFT
jgi:hypothetical protein